MNVEIWSDVVCPWCYIGKRRFERALETFAHRDDVQVTYRSFQLDPAAPAGETRPTVEVLAEKYGGSPADVRQMMARVAQNAAGEGLEYHLEQTLSGNTLDAHRLLHLARERGRQEDVLERLYRAYFTEGHSVFDRASLAQLAAEVGLDADQVKRVLESDAYTSAVLADQHEARALGITGVPFFVIDGRYGVSGAQPADLLSQALAHAWAERHPLQLLTPAGSSASPADDVACADGSCAVPNEARM